VSQVLDASCSASLRNCGAIMDAIANKLVQSDVCAQDLKAQNPLVLQALTGLQNYYLYYGAGCLKDNTTNMYCMFLVIAIFNLGYALAISNSSNPADAASYYLPTIPLVSGARPSCSYCTQHLFDVYYTFSSNKTLEIFKNYYQAAQIVDLNCGAGFVSLGRNTISGTGREHVLPVWTTILMGVGIVMWMFY
jgi:hypothetical protein